jgi:hypothetical protein
MVSGSFLHQKEHTVAVEFSVLLTLSSGLVCGKGVLSTLWGGLASRAWKRHTVAVGFSVLSTLSSEMLDFLVFSWNAPWPRGGLSIQLERIDDLHLLGLDFFFDFMV